MNEPNNPNHSSGYESYFAETSRIPARSDLKELSKLAEQQRSAEVEVDRLKAELSSAVATLNHLSEVVIPERMDSLGISEIRTETGLRLSVEENIRSAVAKDRKAVAWDWLRSNGHGALVKRKVTAEFGRGEDEQAALLVSTLKGQNYNVSDVADVHPQTLQAWVRESLSAGEDIPLELFGVYRQRTAKVKF